MRLIWHISAKDLRRMRLPLGLWLLLVASQVLLAFALSRGFGFDLQVPNRGEYMVTFDELRLLGYVLGIADLVLTYCLMGHLVQIDKVVGQDAFWMTRPISGPRLFGSKLLTAVLVFGILPALVWSPLWIYSGYQLSSLGAAALEIGCLHLCLLPVAFALAALTDTLGRFELWSFVVAIAAIIVPASLSGIISAVLLGLGRVIGETMVVLLCAGNRIAIPDFSAGLAVVTQPVHTMTGIIAQEMGEVVQGSIHYRALFVVGILLFFLSLGINYVAQIVVRRYRISIG